MKKRRVLPIAGKASSDPPCACGSGRRLSQCCLTRDRARAMADAVREHQQGRLDAAGAAYAAILAESPDHADAIHYLGVIEFQRGQFAAATSTIRRAIALRDDVAAYHANLGNALKQCGEFAQAMAAYARSLQLDPAQAVLHFNHGLLLADAGRGGEALAALEKAVRLRPDWAEAWLEYGRRLLAEEAIDAAAEAFRRSLALNPRLAPALLSLGSLLLRFGDVAAALRCFDKAVRLDPDNDAAAASRLFALGLSVEHDGARILAEHLAWQEQVAARVPAAVPLLGERGDRLRIAYLSADLRRHAMRFFARPMFRHHDRKRVSVTVLSTMAPADGDDCTREFREQSDNWIDCRMLDDAALVRCIADAGIDVLVDLAGHSAGGRLVALGAHPARFQCGMLGYMTTTGARGMDARISDAVATPASAEAWYSERILRLPHSQWCYLPDEAVPAVTPLPALGNGHLSYGAFHNVAKLNPQVLALWVRLLASQPEARLLLVAWGREAKAWLRQPFERAGLAERVSILDPLPHDRYLELYQQIDISLDVFPYGAGTVSCESLWMGVPVLSLAHDAPAGRGGASILSAVGMCDWFATSPDALLVQAAAHGGDLARLADLRAGLRQRMRASPLMDAEGYTADLERLLAAQV